ncbi:MAG: ComF family protein [Patescibacteria group bacterium]|jgi:competence protein ComFC|nr:phosphoribosyltransferase family protein [Patescibacteria group bacterium]
MLKKILGLILAFLFPGQCLICQKEAENYLCFECFKRIKIANPLCLSCGQNSELGQFCSSCQRNFYLQGILVAGDLKDQNLEKIIKAFKYRFIKDLASPLSLLLINHLRNQVLTNPLMPSKNKGFTRKNLILTAVPLSKKRQRWRGFNQSQLLAEKVSKQLGIEYWDYLKRPRHQKPQASLNKSDRQINLKNAFIWSGPSLKNKKVLIIDDIATTGATLNEIARELKKHQAPEIWGLVLAHSSS